MILSALACHGLWKTQARRFFLKICLSRELMPQGALSAVLLRMSSSISVYLRNLRRPDPLDQQRLTR